MRWSLGVPSRPTLFGFVVPNQASDKQKCFLKWAEGRGWVLIMQDAQSSSKQCGWHQTKFIKGQVRGAPRTVFAGDPCDTSLREAVKNMYWEKCYQNHWTQTGNTRVWILHPFWVWVSFPFLDCPHREHNSIIQGAIKRWPWVRQILHLLSRPGLPEEGLQGSWDLQGEGAAITQLFWRYFGAPVVIFTCPFPLGLKSFFSWVFSDFK